MCWILCTIWIILFQQIIHNLARMWHTNVGRMLNDLLKTHGQSRELKKCLAKNAIFSSKLCSFPCWRVCENSTIHASSFGVAETLTYIHIFMLQLSWWIVFSYFKDFKGITFLRIMKFNLLKHKAFLSSHQLVLVHGWHSMWILLAFAFTDFSVARRDEAFESKSETTIWFIVTSTWVMHREFPIRQFNCMKTNCVFNLESLLLFFRMILM